jgi:ADP-ribose pyrophosphatase YjhB (NUDIX family)
MEITQDAQKKILVKLIHNNGIKYNDLWAKEGESNKFNYHLKSLIEGDFVKKKDDLYFLTNKGLTYVSAIDGKTAKNKNRPVTCVFVLGYNEKTKEILVNIRKKVPFYDYAGIPGGKIEMGSSPINSAREEFFEETGLKADFKLSAISNYNTYNDDELMHHVIAFTYLATNTSGELIKSNREGENKWMTLEEFKKQKRYPELETFFEKILENRNEIHFFNVNRFQEDDEFVGLDFLSEF